MKEIQIRKNDAGQRLDRFVGKAVPLLPESLLQKYIRRERINRTYGETGQMLYSYKLTFTLPTDAGILEYLRGKTFQVQQVAFAEKYFPGFQIP